MRPKFLAAIFRNAQYKLSALILACLFWYIVQGEEILEVNRRIVVNIKVPDGEAIRGPTTRLKDATLRGSRVLLGDLSTKPLEATIRIPEGKIGPQRYRVDHDMIKGWDNRLKLDVHDPYLTIYVDEKASKKVMVREFLKGIPADGYIIEKTTFKPNIVTITGLKSEVEKIDEVLTEPIDVEGLDETTSFDVKLMNKDQNTALSIDKVTVTLTLGERKINKRFGAVPVEVVGSNFLTAVKPRFVSIVIQGTPGVLSFVKRSDLEAFVEARELGPGKKHERPVQVKIPPDTVLIETLPQSATVEVYNQKRLN